MRNVNHFLNKLGVEASLDIIDNFQLKRLLRCTWFSKNATQSDIKKSYYQVLKDEEKRSLYDQVGHEAFEHQGDNGFQPGGGAGFEHPFGDFFRMDDLEFWMHPFSGGEGVPPGVKPQICKRCKGSGTTMQVFTQKGFFSVQHTCNQCGAQVNCIELLQVMSRAQGKKRVKIYQIGYSTRYAVFLLNLE
ncbi:unnamed protein product [Linum tenue]|uniref:Uncharacterized protein n=1 Tax=Linum tenue TaxID=586396 RepID=A0AAV0Q253_9ROSI|nr:unnamed protein product [Linum tenue]